MKYINKYQTPASPLEKRKNDERQKFLQTQPQFQQAPSNARSPFLGNLLGQGAAGMNYVTGTAGKFGMNMPADIVSLISPKASQAMGDYSFGFLSPTSSEENQQYANTGRLNRANLAAGAAGSFIGGEVAGAAINKAVPYIVKGVKAGGKEIAEVVRPYLLGEKRIPMSGYRPTMNLSEILQNSKSSMIPSGHEITNSNIDDILSKMGKQTGGAFTEGSYNTGNQIYLLKNEWQHNPTLVSGTENLPNDIMPVHQSVVVKTPNGVKNIQLQNKAEGTYLHEIPEQNLQQITQTQIDKAKNAIKEGSDKGVEFDFNGLNNILYHPDKGFQFIDVAPTGVTNLGESSVNGFKHLLKRGITKITDYPADFWLQNKGLILSGFPAATIGIGTAIKTSTDNKL